MTPSTLLAWRRDILGRRATQSDAATELGMSLRAYLGLERSERPIDRRTELACAALALARGRGDWFYRLLNSKSHPCASTVSQGQDAQK